MTYIQSPHLSVSDIPADQPESLADEERPPTKEELEALDRRFKESPIKSLVENFQASPFKAAPEREKELERLISNRGIRIQLTWPGTKFRFEVRDDGMVYAGICTLERLWAYTYGYYHSYLMGRTHAPGTSVTRDTPIAKILEWAHGGSNSPLEKEWPDGTARPDKATSGSEIETVNEIFFVVTAWILLHEIAHIVSPT